MLQWDRGPVCSLSTAGREQSIRPKVASNPKTATKGFGAPDAITRLCPKRGRCRGLLVGEDKATLFGLVVVLACNEPALDRPEWWNAGQ